MNTIETIPDMKSFLVAFTKRMGEGLIRDLSYIPDDKLTQVPMGCARPALEFVTECAGLNLYVAKTLAGETFEPKSHEERKAFYATMDSREKALDFFNMTMEKLQTSLENVTEDELAQTYMAPWGQERKGYELAHIAGIHMAYHDGQVNYIQCLFGDGANHWAE